MKIVDHVKVRYSPPSLLVPTAVGRSGVLHVPALLDLESTTQIDISLSSCSVLTEIPQFAR
jgi:hypothetical protein